MLPQVKGLKHYEGKNSNYYTAHILFKNHRYHIFYETLPSERTIIHEWYNLEKDELEYLTKFINNFFQGKE